MRKTIAPLLTLPAVVLAVAMAMASLGCAKKAPPPPPTAQELFDMGISAYNQENFSLAAGKFEMAVGKSPSFAEAHYYLGLTCWRLGMIDKAMQAFVNVLNLNPNHLGARESLGLLCYRTGDQQTANRQLEAARALNSINPEVYLVLGRIYLAQNRCPEALEVIQRGMMVDSTYLPLRTDLDNAKRQCGKTRGPAPRKAVREKKLRGGGKALEPGSF